MANFERCKACGLVMIAGKYEICPACNVKKSAFEPYHDKVSANRRKLIDMHLHPITVHFPQTVTVIYIGLLLGVLFFSGEFAARLLDTADIIAYMIPLSIPPAFISGLIDGYARMKRVDTPYMIYKSIVGVVLFIVSMAIALLTYYGDSFQLIYYNMALTVVAMATQVYLGQVGIKLMYCIMPGKLKKTSIFAKMIGDA